MFNGEEDYYSSGFYTATEPKEEVKGEGVDTSTPLCPISVEPPSAEKMLKRLRQKLKGKGLKEI